MLVKIQHKTLCALWPGFESGKFPQFSRKFLTYHTAWHVRCVIVTQAALRKCEIILFGNLERGSRTHEDRKKGVDYGWWTYSLVARSTIRSYRIALVVWDFRLDPVKIGFEKGSSFTEGPFCLTPSLF